MTLQYSLWSNQLASLLSVLWALANYFLFRSKALLPGIKTTRWTSLINPYTILRSIACFNSWSEPISRCFWDGVLASRGSSYKFRREVGIGLMPIPYRFDAYTALVFALTRRWCSHFPIRDEERIPVSHFLRDLKVRKKSKWELLWNFQYRHTYGSSLVKPSFISRAFSRIAETLRNTLKFRRFSFKLKTSFFGRSTFNFSVPYFTTDRCTNYYGMLNPSWSPLKSHFSKL